MERNKVEVIDRLEDLKIRTFWDIMQSQNIYLLDTTYIKGKAYTLAQTTAIANVWLLLYDRYFSLKKDQRATLHLDNGFKTFMVLSKISTIENTTNLLEWLTSVKEILTPSDYQFKIAKVYSLVVAIDSRIKIDYLAEEGENLEKIKRFVGALNNEYNIEKSRFKKTDTVQEFNVWEGVAGVSKILEMQLNVKDMTVMEWLSYEQMANKIVMQRQKDLHKRKSNGR